MPIFEEVDQAKLREYLGEKKLQPTVAKTFRLDQAPDAVRYLIEGRPFGCVVMTG
ncbi:NADPH:quinone reductase-like Zn-dependent oxidoreductase [Rhizobium sp. BK512]|uniref:zinc-binding dehydrogenase n=1 Tax=Rhizobium sp. BK512 TaxID=2587010 RepID=UPI001608F0C6|nr:zinc-binding dehydrogenase [Rhizobium sp. BK512]MBB3565779.1 NADPH:quinone reductase-like Zn-dependent oxidoreductase [Rhizobium sp. BK512]